MRRVGPDRRSLAVRHGGRLQDRVQLGIHRRVQRPQVGDHPQVQRTVADAGDGGRRQDHRQPGYPRDPRSRYGDCGRVSIPTRACRIQAHHQRRLGRQPGADAHRTRQALGDDHHRKGATNPDRRAPQPVGPLHSRRSSRPRLLSRTNPVTRNGRRSSTARAKQSSTGRRHRKDPGCQGFRVMAASASFTRRSSCPTASSRRLPSTPRTPTRTSSRAFARRPARPNSSSNFATES